MPPNNRRDEKVLVGITRTGVSGSFLSCGTPEKAEATLQQMTKSDGQPRKLAWRIQGYETITPVDTIDQLREAMTGPYHGFAYSDRV